MVASWVHAPRLRTQPLMLSKQPDENDRQAGLRLARLHRCGRRSSLNTARKVQPIQNTITIERASLSRLSIIVSPATHADKHCVVLRSYYRAIYSPFILNSFSNSLTPQPCEIACPHGCFTVAADIVTYVTLFEVRLLLNWGRFSSARARPRSWNPIPRTPLRGWGRHSLQ